MQQEVEKKLLLEIDADYDNVLCSLSVGQELLALPGSTDDFNQCFLKQAEDSRKHIFQVLKTFLLKTEPSFSSQSRKLIYDYFSELRIFCSKIEKLKDGNNLRMILFTQRKILQEYLKREFDFEKSNELDIQKFFS